MLTSDEKRKECIERARLALRREVLWQNRRHNIQTELKETEAVYENLDILMEAFALEYAKSWDPEIWALILNSAITPHPNSVEINIMALETLEK